MPFGEIEKYLTQWGKASQSVRLWEVFEESYFTVGYM